jgi:hypothetical protein
VLAAHDQARWGMGLKDVGGGHGRPDARWGAVWRAAPGEGGFYKRWLILNVRSTEVGKFRISKWVARELSGRRYSKFCELRLVVCTVWCRYGSTDMGELGSVGEWWTVAVVQRALCPPVCRSSGGHARSEDGRRCSFKLPTHPRYVVQ